jgi:hypothetical protein
MLLRLLTSNLTFHNLKTSSILRNPAALRQNFRNFVRENSSKARKSEKLFLNRPLTLALGLGTSVLLKTHLSTVKCDFNRTTDIIVASNHETKFDWRRLWSYLRNHLWKLLGAIAAALAVAYFNINIPSLLGQLVNALSKYAGTEHGTSADFLQVRNLAKEAQRNVNNEIRLLGCQRPCIASSSFLLGAVNFHFHLHFPAEQNRRADGM